MGKLPLTHFIHQSSAFMTSSLSESGSPKHPSSKNVVDVGKKERHEPSALDSSNTPLNHDSKTSLEKTANRSGTHVESSPELDDDRLHPLREGYTRRLIRMKYCDPEEYDENFDEEM